MGRPLPSTSTHSLPLVPITSHFGSSRINRSWKGVLLYLLLCSQNGSESISVYLAELQTQMPYRELDPGIKREKVIESLEADDVHEKYGRREKNTVSTCWITFRKHHKMLDSEPSVTNLQSSIFRKNMCVIDHLQIDLYTVAETHNVSQKLQIVSQNRSQSLEITRLEVDQFFFLGAKTILRNPARPMGRFKTLMNFASERPSRSHPSHNYANDKKL